MNVLYLYKESKWGKELKYSLRSLEKYVDYDRVYVVGDYPQWITNVTYVPCNQFDDPYKDSLEKLTHGLWVAMSDSEDILLMHDDMYFLEPYEPVVYHNGMLKDRMKGTAGNRKQLFENTLSVIGDDAANYELHYPMPIHGLGYVRTVLRSSMQRKGTVGFMSILGYCNVDYPEKETEDCKFHQESITTKKLEGLPCFSTGGENDRLLHLFDQLYPNKSTFER